MKRHSRSLWQLAGLAVLDAAFFGFINPTNAYAVVVMIGFLLLVATLYVVVDLLLALAERIVTFRPTTRYRLRLSITAFLALLIAMQSIGQLTVKDMAAIIPLVLVAAFYASYQRKQAR
ncbi:MAG TPA: hypothetical protein VFH39_02045 [Candidatus Saccharimonadales bacterium]|nr:hypothetical protein [Candidatus Saccharimonadales bacterium]